MANLAVGTEVFDEYCTSTKSTFVAKCAKTIESHNKRIMSAKGKYPVEWQYVSIAFECKHFGTYKITKASHLENGKCKSGLGFLGTAWLILSNWALKKLETAVLSTESLTYIKLHILF
ncbi:hypothetical protein PoB_000750800 [Plakobranchus ocellatus]|uniref:Uncharacterized protein n=1 Tax=Plakobranchus ocellatus TaxID=259542 RepID=A0AAV3YEU7_9GAST|nr:hypothetical protein PoB_000750800 [Plakobranchus ocellatus]